jgi:mRNA-degrading endonuclease RelE of RelBE toxin-antitoxin system
MGGLFTVVETTNFLRDAAKLWSDDERADFLDYIAANPDAGDIIPDTGGVRKVRWGRRGSGKRDGVRVIYFYYTENLPIYLLMVYAKASREDISPNGKKILIDFAASIKRKY